MTLKASILLYAVLCAQVADWGSTLYAMSFGAIEKNPLMAVLFAVSPFLALVPKLLIPAMVTGIYLGTQKQDRPLMLWVILAYLIVSSVPVVWNVIQLLRAGLL